MFASDSFSIPEKKLKHRTVIIRELKERLSFIGMYDLFDQVNAIVHETDQREMELEE